MGCAPIYVCCTKKLHADLNVPDWSGKCELSFNLNKCKVLYKGKNSKHAHSMRSGNFVSEIDSLSKEKTLETFYSDLKFSDHINEI